MRDFLCLLTGSSLPEIYVDRLFRMLKRHMPEPFRLVCMTERPRNFAEPVEILDISGWEVFRPDMRTTQHRLRYFASETCPLDEFISIDVTLVIKKNLGPMLEFVDSRPEELVIVDDWNRPTVNGSVMRVRRSDALRQIYDDYAAGVRHNVKLHGDQDYIDAVIQAGKLHAHVAHFPEDMVVSYKNLRRLNRRNPKLAQEKLERSLILKFHGKPRPHEVFDWRYHLRTAWRYPRHMFKDPRFAVDVVDREWRKV